ncbi:MAG: ABC transporter permease [Actinomycetota bacterium]|nr:ABC transporter permease [Actinomycetota bacterium]
MSSPTHTPNVLKTAAVLVALQLAYVFFFVYPGHDPQPNGLRIGVVATATQTRTVEHQLDAVELPGSDLVRFDSAEQARSAITNRDVYGAVVFDGKGEQVLTAPAASFTVSSLLTQAASQAKGARVAEVVPLSSGDPRGVVLNLLIIPLIVTGLLGAQLAVQIVGTVRLKRRLWTVALVAAAGALAVATLIGPVLGTLPGPLLPEAAVLTLAIFGLLTVGGGLIRLLGPAGLFFAFAIFLMIGNPSSGVASAPELLPTPWAQAGAFLTPGALASALRSIAYFDSARSMGPLLVLAIIAAVGIALEALADRTEARKRRAPGE